MATALCAVTPACASLDGLAEDTAPPAKGSKSAVVGAKTCAAAQVRVRDTFEGRTDPLAMGWTKGRVSDGMPSITTPSARTTSILSSSVAATTDEEGKTTSYLEREIPTTSCVATELTMFYTEAAPFPESAWSYFMWIDAADDMNVSLFRRGNVVRLAAQRGGTELSRVDVELPPEVWTKLKIEVDVGLARPTVSVTAGTGAAQKMTLAEPLAPPYFLSLGTWARGAVPAHEVFYDDVRISY